MNGLTNMLVAIDARVYLTFGSIQVLTSYAFCPLVTVNLLPSGRPGNRRSAGPSSPPGGRYSPAARKPWPSGLQPGPPRRRCQDTR
jgi:hypothetical protein